MSIVLSTYCSCYRPCTERFASSSPTYPGPAQDALVIVFDARKRAKGGRARNFFHFAPRNRIATSPTCVERSAERSPVQRRREKRSAPSADARRIAAPSYPSRLDVIGSRTGTPVDPKSWRSSTPSQTEIGHFDLPNHVRSRPHRLSEFVRSITYRPALFARVVSELHELFSPADHSRVFLLAEIEKCAELVAGGEFRGGSLSGIPREARDPSHD